VRYLGLALFAEGPSDHAFLRPLLGRLCAQVCAESARESIEIGDVYELHSPPTMKDRPRGERIFHAAREASGLWNLLFIHADANGDAAAARRERVHPAVCRIVTALGEEQGQVVAVVPVRETEAWILADGENLRTVFGTHKGDPELGVPSRPRDVEKLADPKQCLEKAFRVARDRKARARERTTQWLPLIGEQISLQVLDEVPAFAHLRADLFAALQVLHYLPRQ
jgi:hypothetical protein